MKATKSFQLIQLLIMLRKDPKLIMVKEVVAKMQMKAMKSYQLLQLFMVFEKDLELIMMEQVVVKLVLVAKTTALEPIKNSIFFI